MARCRGWRFRRTQPVSGMVSIIIPTCAARGYVETCIKTLREHTTYRNFEIICVDNIPDKQIGMEDLAEAEILIS